MPSQVIGGAVLSRAAALTIGLWERLLKYTLTACGVTITVTLESTNLPSRVEKKDRLFLALVSPPGTQRACIVLQSFLFERNCMLLEGK